jgi:hypothetical protein
VNIASFNPATAEGGFPVSLQNVNLTRDVSNQFFAFDVAKLEEAVKESEYMDVAKQPKVLTLMVGAGVVGAVVGWMAARRQAGI